jgi:putative protein-disulfide isomerase
MTNSPKITCDPTTGLCTLPVFEGEANAPIEFREDVEIIYVGDPMCSGAGGSLQPYMNWNNGRNSVESLFGLWWVGLRPGGGDEWNEQFTSFLQHHWEEIHQRSGQPFNYELLQRDSFNYDTEPSCRAVVAARTLDPNAEHLFFELVQHHFYVQNQDPNQVNFYAPICTKLDLDFDAFKALFESEEIKKRTQSEFAINRQWGVRGYPTVLLQKQDQLHLLARGYASSEEMWERLGIVFDL